MEAFKEYVACSDVRVAIEHTRNEVFVKDGLCEGQEGCIQNLSENLGLRVRVEKTEVGLLLIAAGHEKCCCCRRLNESRKSESARHLSHSITLHDIPSQRNCCLTHLV